MTDERDAADALGDAIDEIHRLEAELTELRALKAKIDGMKPVRVSSWMHPEDREQALTRNDIIAWLRGGSDG